MSAVQTRGMDLFDSLDFIDPDARDVVTVSGTDAATYLQSQVAQDLDQMSDGQSGWTFVLEPTGKVVSLARIARVSETEFVLDTDAGFGDVLAERLNRFKIRVDADIELTPAASAEPSLDHEAARVAAGWPRHGFEIVPGETIPAVTGVVPVAVSFTKGCYPGQELVERMDSRGADAPRMLRVVEVGEGTRVGDAVDGADGVVVTTVAGTAALAYVPRGVDVGRAVEHGPSESFPSR